MTRGILFLLVISGIFLHLCIAQEPAPDVNVRVADARFEHAPAMRLRVHLNEIEAISDITPGELTAWGKLTPGPYQVSVASSTGVPVPPTSSIEITSDSFTTIVMSGATSNLTLYDVKIRRSDAEKLSKERNPTLSLTGVNLSPSQSCIFAYQDSEGLGKEVVIPPGKVMQLPAVGDSGWFKFSFRNSSGKSSDVKGLPRRELMAGKACILLLPDPDAGIEPKAVDGAGGFYIAEER